jgi:hypothetical protein
MPRPSLPSEARQMRVRLILCSALTALLGGCVKEASAPPAAPSATASAFIARANHDLSELAREVQAANFIQAIDTTPDTEFIGAKANDRYLALAKGRDFDELVAAWKGWHDIGVPMRASYQRFVVLANEGAREFGFKDLGIMITEYFGPLMGWRTLQNKNRQCGWE